MKIYQALPYQPGLIDSQNLGKLGDLSLLAVGVFCHLRWKGKKTLEQLGESDSLMPYAEIETALNELIVLGLVAEIQSEVQGGAS